MPQGAAGANAGGLLESLKALIATAVRIVHTRIELLANDIAIEGAHLATLVVLVAVALFLLGVGVVLVALFIAVAFWESHRLLALGVLAASFVIAGASLAAFAVYKARRRPRLFAASLAELGNDRRQLSGEA